MNKTSSERLAEAMARARRQRPGPYQAEPPATWTEQPRRTPFTITISREAGAKGSLVAALLGERLGWPVFDRELVQLLADSMGVRADMVEHLDECRANWLKDCIEAFALAPTVSHDRYMRHLVETLLTLAAHGECVVVGRGAAQALPRASTLRVRLVADRDDRIRTIQERSNVTQRDAAHWVETVDRERSQFVKDHFHLDPADPRNYDLVINTSRLTVAETTDLIIETLRRLEARAPTDAARAAPV